jgi:hypothetical protein
MAGKIDKAVNAVRDALHAACKDMPPSEYKQVLEELSSDLTGNLDALRDENPYLFD